MKNCLQCTLAKIGRQQALIINLSQLQEAARSGDVKATEQAAAKIKAGYENIYSLIAEYSDPEDRKLEHCLKCVDNYIQFLDLCTESLDSISTTTETASLVADLKEDSSKEIATIKAEKT